MRPIPARILTASATLNATMAADKWQHLTGGTDIPLTRVHVQRGAGLKLSGGFDGNAEALPNAELYYDCRLSLPRGLNWIALKRAAEEDGASLTIAHGGADYVVTYVDEVPDDRGTPHHYRVEMR